ncbi:MAG: methylhydantoinase [Acidobacteria bacterium]|nr:MAG: methylhydantoinase [Acidobacteriota bacterium]
MWTFELDPGKNGYLEIHLNKQGISEFIETLENLLTEKGNEHYHLMTPDWGGDELTLEKQCEENSLIQHVKIYKWEE